MIEIGISFGLGILVGSVCSVAIMALCAANGDDTDNDFNRKDGGDDQPRWK